MKKIIIMSEYQCFPLWEAKDGGLQNFEAYSLSIPKEVAKRIELWGDLYENTYLKEDPDSSGFKSEQKRESFIQSGYEILHELRSHINEETQIEYRTIDGKKIQL